MAFHHTKYGTCSFNHLTHQNYSQALKFNGTVMIPSFAGDGRQGTCRHAGMQAERHRWMNRETERRTDRGTERETDRQTDRQTGKQTD